MSYVSTYGKSYPTKSEFKNRQSNYATADSNINAFNASGSTSKVAHNQFSTWSPSELKALKGTAQPTLPVFPNEKIKDDNQEALPSAHAPTASEINWVAKGMVTPVQN